MSSCDWQRTQNFSQKQLASGDSHCAQTIRFIVGLEDMAELYREQVEGRTSRK
jgi:hypothetical protein